ncbi:MAG: hypothetical protein A3K19_32005 [Lentisphaerae bacterium RIFOXYB12_FULL_65_16]|nr:MAG: hypothetical protein A3K18_10785 [Lentisphaerae bacterium RIFOXYA12_64_32]OGV88726.1 MAG: hypothetical protein A3K19_32005 [Lentisphaerae bacterium RIFOXYB12_FULL_65_16]
MKRSLWVIVGLVLGVVLMGNFAGAQTCNRKAGAACPMKAGATCGVKAATCQICPKCGEEKGGDKCCKADAVKCEKCGLDKGSVGCCKFPAAAKEKGEAAEYCPTCKQFVADGKCKCCAVKTEAQGEKKADAEEKKD